jgi:hypothetical protein
LYNQRFAAQGWEDRSWPVASEGSSIGVRVESVSLGGILMLQNTIDPSTE